MLLQVLHSVFSWYTSLRVECQGLLSVIVSPLLWYALIFARLSIEAKGDEFAMNRRIAPHVPFVYNAAARH
jgi:hypothetical protein